MADEAVRRSGQESSAFCGKLQHSLSEALAGMTIYDIARPATRTLLAEYKCLITALKQDSQSYAGSNGLAAGLLALPDLLWDDGMDSLSMILTSLDSGQAGGDDASAAEMARPISWLTQAQYKHMAAISAVPGRDPDNAGRTSQPDNKARDLLLKLGMPPDAATRCYSRLMWAPAQMRVVKFAVRPCFRWQLETYLRGELHSAGLVCAIPRVLPPVMPCWGTINASTDEAMDFIRASAALGRFAWRGVSIARLDSKHGGQEVGGWSFMDGEFFYGVKGRQVTETGDGQVRAVVLL